MKKKKEKISTTEKKRKDHRMINTKKLSLPSEKKNKDAVFFPLYISLKKKKLSCQLKKQKSVSARQLKCSFSRLILNTTGL